MDFGVAGLAKAILSTAAEELFGRVGRSLLSAVGLIPDEEQAKRDLLDEYTALIDQRLASKVIYRLDEDRMAELRAGLAQLRAASETELRREYLANAANTFFKLASLPDEGSTAGIENRQVKSIASLGLAAVHVAFEEMPQAVAEGVALAVRLHRETAVLWLGQDVVEELVALYPDEGDGALEAGADVVVPSEPAFELAAPPGALHREQVKEAVRNATGRVELSGASLEGADLSGLDLRLLNLRGSDLTGADLSNARLGDPSFWGLHAELQSAVLLGAVLPQAELSRCNLGNAILVKAVADGAAFTQTALEDLDAAEASFVGAHFAKAAGQRVVFTGANLERANLEKVSFADARLNGARLSGANLTKARLPNAVAVGADLTEAIAPQMALESGDWRKADFSRSDISRSKLLELDLEEAVMRDTNLQGCHLVSLDLRRVDLEGADLRGVKYNNQTLWPPGLVPVTRGAELAQF